jgi:N-acetylgalactosamine-N,N'-diacetylbacillosaminyl-diphospho-undecaprenol 4-alpha-N-acetylgalactosaminyltransferase
MQKKKVALLINSLYGGGAERMVSVLANGLKDNFEIHIILLENIINYELPQGQIIKVIGNDQNTSSSFLNIAKLPSLALNYHRYCKENNIELSVSFLNRASYVNALAKSLYKSKYKAIVCERTHQLSWLKHTSALNKFLTITLIKTLYNQADILVANSKQIKKDLQLYFKLRPPIKVIYNTVDKEKINALMFENIAEVLDPALFYFINVGGFRIEKNHSVLIKAMVKLKDKQCRLLLVGKGELEEKLKAQVKDLGLIGKVIFIPYQTNPFKYVHKANCFVLSSNVEGMPNVLLEAMACSVPIISTDCLTGPREILSPDTEPSERITEGYELAPFGILCAERSENALGDAMIKMYDDTVLQKKYEDISTKRVADFSASIILTQFLKAFSE